MTTPHEHDSGSTPRPDDPTIEVPSSPGVTSASPSFSASMDAQKSPKTIGPYRVIRRLGHGGMGVVYLAQRDDGPIRRQVAVKLMRPGLEVTEVAARFERERQVLAALDHPNIARILDAGSTEDGLPYFVMEFIEGQPLDRYCDDRRLTIEERLKLFRQVCAAVHHAHQNLVVHRDIKPRNILVTNDGTPKLLDFGIAKLLNVNLAPVMDLHTQTGVRLMTPEYASPEQVRGQSVTTAADVYSLGVVLFELLTGHRPFRLRTRLMQEVERVICEQDPERPSTMITRVERLGQEETEDGQGTEEVVGWTGTITPEEVSKARSAGVSRLRRALAGDLDNIVLMAMRKEPHRRYRSAEQLAEDIQRHLEGHPVLARPDTLGYRMGKFVVRHRGGVAAAALVALALVGGVVASSIFAARAERAREQAVSAEARAVERFNEVRALANVFLFDLYDRVNTLEGSLSARQLMVDEGVRYLDRLAAEANEDPTLSAEVAAGYQRLGEIQSSIRGGNLGDAAGAKQSYGKALQLRRSLAAAEPENVLYQMQVGSTLLSLGDLARMEGRLDEAMSDFTQAIAIFDRQPPDSKSEFRLAVVLSSLADALMDAGRFADAAPYVERSMELRKNLLARHPANPDIKRAYAVGLGRQADIAFENGDKATAIRLLAENLRVRRELAQVDPDNGRFKRDLFTAIVLLGDTRRSLGTDGDLEAALVELNEAVELAVELLNAAPTDWRGAVDLAGVRTIRGETLLDLGRIDESIAELEIASQGADQASHRNPENVRASRTAARAHELLARALEENDRARAIESLDRAIVYWRALVDEVQEAIGHQASCSARMGFLLTDAGRVGEGRAMLESANRLFQQMEENGMPLDDFNTLRDRVVEALEGEWTFATSGE